MIQGSLCSIQAHFIRILRHHIHDDVISMRLFSIIIRRDGINDTNTDCKHSQRSQTTLRSGLLHTSFWLWQSKPHRWPMMRFGVHNEKINELYLAASFALFFGVSFAIASDQSRPICNGRSNSTPSRCDKTSTNRAIDCAIGEKHIARPHIPRHRHEIDECRLGQRL